MAASDTAGDGYIDENQFVEAGGGASLPGTVPATSNETNRVIVLCTDDCKIAFTFPRPVTHSQQDVMLIMDDGYEVHNQTHFSLQAAVHEVGVLYPFLDPGCP